MSATQTQRADRNVYGGVGEAREKIRAVVRTELMSEHTDLVPEKQRRAIQLREF